jgi:hypothetical protein
VLRRVSAVVLLALLGGCIKDDLSGTRCNPDAGCELGYFCYPPAPGEVPRCYAGAPDAGGRTRVTVTVEGPGAVVSEGQRCSAGTCTFLLGSAEATFSAEASADAGGVKVRWGDACAGARRALACSLTLGSNPTVSARFGVYNYAFVTSRQVRVGDLGGATGANTFCDAVARDAGIPGNFLALLTVGTNGPRARLAATSARGFFTTDELPVGDTVADLFDGARMWYPPADERENFTPAVEAITGATLAGQADPGNDCDGWTSISGAKVMKVGITGGGYAQWMSINTTSCDNPGPLYCFGTDAIGALPGPGSIPAGGRRVFLSAAWTPGGGPGSAAAQCVSEAQSLGLPGLYTALLSTADAGARAALGNFDGGYYRIDGVLLAVGADALLGPVRRASLDVRPDGGRYANYTWTGGDPTQPSAASCDSWRSDAGTGETGWAPLSHGGVFYGGQSQSCDTALPVYCVQVD